MAFTALDSKGRRSRFCEKTSGLGECPRVLDRAAAAYCAEHQMGNGPYLRELLLPFSGKRKHLRSADRFVRRRPGWFCHRGPYLRIRASSDGDFATDRISCGAEALQR